jgi:exopolysaccharide biosynthesis protein
LIKYAVLMKILIVIWGFFMQKRINTVLGLLIVLCTAVILHRAAVLEGGVLSSAVAFEDTLVYELKEENSSTYKNEAVDISLTEIVQAIKVKEVFQVLEQPEIVMMDIVDRAASAAPALEESERKTSESKGKEEEPKKVEVVPAATSTPREEKRTGQYFYEAETITVKITDIVKNNPRVHGYAAHIIVKDPETQIKAVGASNNHRERTSVISRRQGAVVGMNASGFNLQSGSIHSAIIRDGHLIKNEITAPFAIKGDGTMFVPERSMSGEELLQLGVTNTAIFGPVLIKDGMKLPISPVDHHNVRHPRSAVGQISKDEYILIVVDGRRSGYSAGMTLSELQEEFFKRGAVFAYNLDGGGSTALYFNGRLVNRPSDASGERAVADVICFME